MCLPLLDSFCRTPLHSAIALSKTYDISRVLLEKGGDLQNRTVEGKTPLHTFSSQVSEQVLRCHGSLFDYSIVDHRGMNVLHYMAWSSKTSKETLKKFHELGNFDLKQVDAEDRSLLHFAAQRGNVPVMEYILCATKHYNMNHADCRGRTALHYGTENKRASEILTLLISHGANVWPKDHEERSALHYAARLGNLPAVKTLLQYGMIEELRMTDCFGMTPLMISSYHKAHAVVMFLLETEGRSNGDPAQIPDFVECGQSYHPLHEGRKGSFHGHQTRLSSSGACWQVIKYLAIMTALLVLVVLLGR